MTRNFFLYLSQQQRLRRWRMTAIAASAMAASLAVVIGVREYASPAGDQNYVFVARGFCQSRLKLQARQGFGRGLRPPAPWERSGSLVRSRMVLRDDSS